MPRSQACIFFQDRIALSQFTPRQVGHVFHAQHVCLKHRIGSLPPGTGIAELSVKLDTFEMTAVLATTGAVEQTTCVLSSVDLGLTPDAIIDEVRDLLHRGHVLGIPGCTCQPAGGGRRARQLGVGSSLRARCACLDLGKKRFGHSEVEAQLLATSLAHATVGARSVLEVLVQSEVFEVGRDTVALCMAQQVHDKATLLAHVCKHPLGINETSSSMQYAALFRDLESLQADNKVVVLRGALGCRRVFPVSVEQRPVCEKIRAMWFASTS